jgi:hypothetical protein
VYALLVAGSFAFGCLVILVLGLVALIRCDKSDIPRTVGELVKFRFVSVVIGWWRHGDGAGQ